MKLWLSIVPQCLLAESSRRPSAREVADMLDDAPLDPPDDLEANQWEVIERLSTNERKTAATLASGQITPAVERQTSVFDRIRSAVTSIVWDPACLSTDLEVSLPSPERHAP